MGYKMQFKDRDNLEVFLSEIEGASEKVSIKFLRRAGKIVQQKVIDSITRSTVDKPNYRHMKDDVLMRVERDEYGHRAARIRGSKKTGSKWHLLNDGTYKMRGTHFMDKALNDAESEIDHVLDETMRESGLG